MIELNKNLVNMELTHDGSWIGMILLVELITGRAEAYQSGT